MFNTKSQMQEVIKIVEHAAIDVGSYDDESETLVYHSEKLNNALTVLKQIHADMPNDTVEN